MSRAVRPSLARRAFLALMLFVGFYVLAIFMMGALAFVGYLDLASGHLHVQLLVVLLIGFIAIFISIIPRPDPFEPAWPTLTAAQHPVLFAKLEGIAASAGQRMPDEVYLLPDLNAWVMDRGRGGQRRVMGIGLPLLYILDIPQFTAVIAHEFGHYYGGDTRLGPWTYKTHATIGRTLQNLDEKSVRIIQAPFQAYGRMFLRVSRSVSREQEYTADRFAASLAGPDAVASSLKKLAGYDAGVAIFMHQLLLPTLACGFRPAVMGGLSTLAESPAVAESARKLAEKNIKDAAEDLFDTHPCLRDRLAAIEGLPAVVSNSSIEAGAAVTLLGELNVVEDQWLSNFLNAEQRAALTPIEWTDVGERVFIDRWTRLRDHNRTLLESWTLDELGAMFFPGNVAITEVKNSAGRYVDPEEQYPTFYSVLSACLSLAARDAGWTLVAQPDVGLCFTRDGKEWDTEFVFNGLARGGVSHKVWTDVCRETGIAGRLMTGGMSPTGAGTRWLRDFRGQTAVVTGGELAPAGLRYEGGNGATIETAIIIRGAYAEADGERAVMSRLREWYGVKGADWDIVRRSRRELDGRQIEVIELVFKNGSGWPLYFDVTDYTVTESNRAT